MTVHIKQLTGKMHVGGGGGPLGGVSQRVQNLIVTM